MPEALATAAKMMGLGEEETARQIYYHQAKATGNPTAYLADFAYRTALMALGSVDPAQPDGVVLDVPFVSQLGPDANLSNGDCGPACVAMCIAYAKRQAVTVNDLVREMKALNRYTTASDLIATLKAWGIASRNYGEFDRESGSLTLDVIEKALVNKKPVIALVNYGVLQPGKSFKGLHWVVVAGFHETSLLVLDPLHEHVATGSYWVGKQTFELALAYTKKLQAQARHGIVVGP